MTDSAGESPPEWQASWAQSKLDASEDFDMSKIKPPLFGSRLEEMFCREVHEPKLQFLRPVVKGLTRLRPCDRISASEALDLVEAELEAKQDTYLRYGAFNIAQTTDGRYLERAVGGEESRRGIHSQTLTRRF